MVNNKSQISVEYMILTGFVLLAVVVPAAFFLYSFANKGVSGSIQAETINALGNGIVENSKQMYYLGLYSKKVVELDVPINVEHMFIMELDDGTDKFYYFGVFINDGSKRTKNFFQSDVPLISKLIPLIIDNDPAVGALIPECSSFTCSFYNFRDFSILKGKKRFKIETVLEGSEIKASIVPLEN